MGNQINKIRIIYGALVGGVIIAALICIYDGLFSSTVPPDDQLIEVFNLHREAFEALQRMASEAMRDDQRPHGVQEQKENERLKAEIDKHIYIGIDKYWTRYIFAQRGNAISPGWVKGIEYVPGSYERAGTICTNLDHADRMPPDIYLRPITTNWFLFYQRDD